MVSILYNERDFEGWKPEFDPRRLSKAAVIKGENFLFDVDGPRSAFATRFANWWAFDDKTKAHVKEFRVGRLFFYGTPTGIWKVDPVSLAIDLVLPITTLKRYWPWSYAKVGNRYYFAQFNAGLWEYNQEDDEWTEVATPTNAGVKFVCLAYGRLVCLSDVVVFWSALDNGRDFTPSITTGAGFQALSILSENAFRVDAVSDGVIVTTDLGWIKGEFVASSAVFYWDVLSQAVRSWSPNMTCLIPDIGLVSLDGTGFHISAGKKPEIWEAGHGEFLKNKFLDNTDRKKFGCCGLYYAPSSRLLFVMFAHNMREGTYTWTSVYSVASGKWGQMAWPHHGIFEVTKQPLGIDVPAYMDLRGFMQAMSARKNKESCPENIGFVIGDYVHRLWPEPLPRVVTDADGHATIIGIAEMHFSPENPNLFNNIPGSGLYYLRERRYSDTKIIAGGADPDWTFFEEAAVDDPPFTALSLHQRVPSVWFVPPAPMPQRRKLKVPA